MPWRRLLRRREQLRTRSQGSTGSQYTCPVCHADPKTSKQHFESKYPKSPMVPVLVDVQA
uniref:Uncharacterized protein n=1 Tax=Hucho hucho TaxID=62062 RepID=A0A4W5NAJ1_9TELE